MSEHDGGPAFPWGGEVCGGMNLRDWFAGQAPEVPDWWGEIPASIQPPGWEQGMKAADWDRIWTAARLKRVASWRWAYADAMLAERAKP